MDNILILGLPKSGTSGLLMLLSSIFPKHSVNLERIQFIEDSDFVKGIICKDLIDSPEKTNTYKEVYKKFTKIVFIVRDPRDRVVSSILYGGFNTIVNKLDIKEEFLKRLRDKETKPMNVSCLELVSILRSGLKCKTNNDLQVPTLGAENYLLESLENISNINVPNIIIKYEDFVDNKLEILEDFLEVKFQKTGMEFSRTARSKRYGEWKNWFTDKDIEYFKSIANPILEKFKYEDWSTNPNPFIDPEKSSVWAEKKINERYEMYLNSKK